jgi:hypothetical protein
VRDGTEIRSLGLSIVPGAADAGTDGQTVDRSGGRKITEKSTFVHGF